MNPARSTNARRSLPILACSLACMFAGTFGGCHGTQTTSAYTPPSDITRNRLRSEELTQQAGRIMESDPTEAERLLKAALAEDLYNGAAHNNLGVLCLRSDPPRLYEAANEFEWAAKLMPGQPDARFNLALVMERAGRLNDARDGYRLTLEVAPAYMPAIQARASLTARAIIRDEADVACLRRDLQEISLRGTSEHWRQWARQRLLAMQ